MNTCICMLTSIPMCTPMNTSIVMKPTRTSTHTPTPMNTSMNIPTNIPMVETSTCTATITLETTDPMSMSIQPIKLKRTITRTNFLQKLLSRKGEPHGSPFLFVE